MNVFEKLQICRVELQNLQVKKSGLNKFSGYNYYELSDFLPVINKLMLDNKLSSFVNFTSDVATLTIVNSEKFDEQIIFTSPMSSANLKGCHDVQNLGATQTYLRRYLYTIAFEIVEADVLDLTHNENEEVENKGNKQPLSTVTDPQIKRLYALGNKADIKPKEIFDTCKKLYGINKLQELTQKQYKEVCERIEAKAK